MHQAPSRADCAARAASVTELLAGEIVDCDLLQQPCDGAHVRATALRIVETIHVSRILTLPTPEGFAYYAIHPLDFADLVAQIGVGSSSAFVVGIRSIGTTLSAVVAAKLRSCRIAAQRITVRPVGHPYDRQCHFEGWQCDQIRRALGQNAAFLICDEGPGRSGSSFLAVAEALEREGVSRGRIHLLCSHEPDVRTLCARDAKRRWGRYARAASGMTRRLPAKAETYIGGGEWRRHFITAGEPWPAVWPQMERLKFLSRDGQNMFKFEGHGPCGAQVSARNQELAESGFAGPYLGHEFGFGQHAVLHGQAVRMADLTPDLLTHMAEYCAWRSRQFQVANTDAADLQGITRTNFEREFGAELHGLCLPVERPAVCDSRMQPGEWLFTGTRWLKLDAAKHGDDHFFPGPCDVAWDLAGIVVEWELDSAAQESLLSRYLRASGDDASRRLAAYKLAYTTFRMAWSRMAAASAGEADEEVRLLCDYRKYRRLAQAARGQWQLRGSTRQVPLRKLSAGCGLSEDRTLTTE